MPHKIGIVCGAAVALAIVMLIGYIVHVLAGVGPAEIATVLAAVVGVLGVVPLIIRALRTDRP
ncbi:hypothetical protein AB0J52_29745 [Spirillospora sp. NPDC049652]